MIRQGTSCHGNGLLRDASMRCLRATSCYVEAMPIKQTAELQGNHLSNTTCLTQVSSNVAKSVANYDDP